MASPARLTDFEMRELALLRRLDQLEPWKPQQGPQTLAYESVADIIGFGGAAGGGKSDLGLGKALTRHSVVQVFRRDGTELTALIDRCVDIVSHREGLGGKPAIWRNPTPRCKLIEFCSVPNLGDERKFQGRAKDLLLIDEAANFLEAQVRFLMGWMRSVDPKQRCQALLTFNPPTSSDGLWIVDYFGPWLDDKHPHPAKPGELRWFATVAGKDIELSDNTPFVIVDDKVVFEFEPLDYEADQIITPMSRTFIPSRVGDNKYLRGTNYMAVLQALPEPLRSQMLYGDFKAGMRDDPWQVIPTVWVDAAMARWKKLDVKPPMDTMGVDVARGGKDNTVLARRHGNWYDEPLIFAGTEAPDGPAVAGQVVAALRDHAPILIDVIGVGASPYDFLKQTHQIIGVNVSEKSLSTDKSGRLRFMNQRSELWWAMREALDPENNQGIALPPDKRLRAELCAPMWSTSGPVVKVESREEIVKRIGRSPDLASAYILAAIDIPKRARMGKRKAAEYDPYSNLR